MSLLKRLFGRRGPDAGTVALYGRIVARAREPVFYASLGVPDSPEGRFDLLVLHAFLVMDALSQTQPQAAQSLFDLMFDDMEVNLRELGASDIRIGARVKSLAQDFFGRSEAYRNALVDKDKPALMAALDRNLFAKKAAEAAHLALLAEYVAAAWGREAVAEGEFPPIPTPLKASP
ncbi:MAG: ubiquinol-cytochrome C chaperone [Rhodospirillales bacterium]|nr:ubiquinol-cytochrome C chaperone [Rhodospirillales bacterium]